MDERYTINFVGGLTTEEMRKIALLLLDAVKEGESVGICALTKIEFVEPDTCQYRYWCTFTASARVNFMVGLWFRLHEIHPIRNVDGVTLPWFK